MNYLNVDGIPGLVRDKTSGAIINTNANEISTARTRKYLQRLEKERVNRLEQDVNSIKQDIGDIRNLLIKMLEDKNGNNQS